MTKNIIIIILLIITVAEAGYIIDKKDAAIMGTSTNNIVTAVSLPSARPNIKSKGPVIISKGMNLTKTSLFQYAYEIAPKMANNAKTVMTGFSVASQTQTDGSITVTLTPKDSSDQIQQYIIKPGQILYYIEQIPLDDKINQDKDLNYRDDYGIITDANGIVQ